ncbi:MarR family winged helix-turn-helix transcriptional regulator [Dysosmobacter sp.]|uniref:MarR family winged helix-turn-helix transcriptional regulator n=1 Tax=Dysosmobacter sp. TaxID=2591382 RepID=UPI003D8B4EDD
MNTLLKWLSVVDRFSKLYLDRQLAVRGINSSQHMFLIKICENPGILQDSLIDTIYLHPSNIVRTVASLEQKGLLIRKPCEEDKRTCRLYPTNQAMAMIADVETACAQTEAVLLQGFGDEEKAAFEKALMLMGKNITSAMKIYREEDEFDA